MADKDFKFQIQTGVIALVFFIVKAIESINAGDAEQPLAGCPAFDWLWTGRVTQGEDFNS